MDDLTLAARLAEKEGIEKRFVRNVVNRLNPLSEENRAVSDARQVKASEQALGGRRRRLPGANYMERRQAAQQTRAAHRLGAARNRQAERALGSVAAQGMDAQNPAGSTDPAATAQSNQQLVGAYASPEVPATMVNDDAAAPAAPADGAAPAAQAAPQGPDDQGNMPLPQGQPQGQQPQGQMPGMNMENFLGAARMYADQGMAQREMRQRQQMLRQNDPAYKAQVADANRRATQRGGLLNAATFGLSGAIGRARGRRDLRNLRASTMKSSDRVDLEDLLLAKSAVRERDGTDRLRGLK